MPERVSAEARLCGNPRTQAGALGNQTNGSGISKRRKRCPAVEKEVPAGGARSSMLEIGGDGLADLLDEG